MEGVEDDEDDEDEEGGVNDEEEETDEEDDSDEKERPNRGKLDRTADLMLRQEWLGEARNDTAAA